MLFRVLLLAFIPAFDQFRSGPLAAHDIRLSHTRIVVDGTSLRARFDLSRAGAPTMRLSPRQRKGHEVITLRDLQPVVASRGNHHELPA